MPCATTGWPLMLSPPASSGMVVMPVNRRSNLTPYASNLTPLGDGSSGPCSAHLQVPGDLLDRLAHAGSVQSSPRSAFPTTCFVTKQAAQQTDL
jgi:hypothetical protein